MPSMSSLIWMPFYGLLLWNVAEHSVSSGNLWIHFNLSCKRERCGSHLKVTRYQDAMKNMILAQFRRWKCEQQLSTESKIHFDFIKLQWAIAKNTHTYKYQIGNRIEISCWHDNHVAKCSNVERIVSKKLAIFELYKVILDILIIFFSQLTVANKARCIQ